MNRLRRGLLRFRRQWILQCFALTGIAFLAVFNFIPLFGILIAFKDYKVRDGVMGFFTSPNVGFKWFVEFYNDLGFWNIIRNTVLISVTKLIFIFPLPVVFALALNELRNLRLKRIVQTVSYFPHFISWVVVSGMLFSFFNAQTGLINRVLRDLGLITENLTVISSPEAFLPMVVWADIWKGLGWSSIIFLAAITSVDQDLYEAAIVDGAGRLSRMWHITLPCIKGTIVILLILNMGGLLTGNFEQSYLLGNAGNLSRSEIVPTYVIKMGLTQMRYSYATAIGLAQSVISLLLVLISNAIAQKISGTGLI